MHTGTKVLASHLLYNQIQWWHVQGKWLMVQASKCKGGLTADALAFDGRDDRPADLGALALLPKSSSSSSSP